MEFGVRDIGGYIVLTVVMAMAFVVTTASVALAHGDHGAEPVAVSEEVGPYRVSVWVEEFSDNDLRVNAVIKGIDSAPPQLWVDSGDGRRVLPGLTAEGNGTWTVAFHSSLGESLVVGWDHRLGMIPLDPLPTPVWFRYLLLAVTPVGVWFMYWLATRTGRVFTPIPAKA